jgi:hypothetical protein
MLHLDQGQRLHKCIGNHIVCRAIHKVQGTLLDHPVDPMVTYINMLRAGVVLIVTSEGDRSLIVPEEDYHFIKASKYFGEETAQPECLLHAMSGRDILTLGSGQQHNLLALG